MNNKKWGVIDMNSPKLIDDKMYYQVEFATDLKQAYSDLVIDMTNKYVIKMFDIQDMEIKIK